MILKIICKGWQIQILN
jgi:hypothetical protein